MLKKLPIATFLAVLTFTGLGLSTSTAFSQNLESYLSGDMKNVTLLEAPKELPEISFKDGKGETRSLSEFKGQVLLVNFWATWCAPCREEMPSLDNLQGQLGSDDFTVLAVGQDLQGIEKTKKFLKALKIKHLEAYNDKTVKSGRTLGVFGLPATLIIDRQGREVGRLVGPAEWDSEEAIELLQAVIDQ